MIPTLPESSLKPRIGRTCEGKYGFYTRQHAKNAARFKEEQLGIKMNVYLCDYCNCWHIGHKNEWVATQSKLSKTIATACRQLGADVV